MVNSDQFLADILAERGKQKVLLHHVGKEYISIVIKDESQTAIDIYAYKMRIETGDIIKAGTRFISSRLADWRVAYREWAQEIGLTQELIDKELGIDSTILEKAKALGRKPVFVVEVRRMRGHLAVLYCLGEPTPNTTEFLLRYRGVDYSITCESFYSTDTATEALFILAEYGVLSGTIKSAN